MTHQHSTHSTHGSHRTHKFDPANVERLLKPGGSVVLVEWQKRDGPPGPPAEHRLSVEEVLAHGREAGLHTAEQRDLNEHHYLIALRPGEGTR